jgi:hypothetical protein
MLHGGGQTEALARKGEEALNAQRLRDFSQLNVKR